MSKARFVLGVDLDGVCADFYGAFRPIVAEWFEVPVENLTTSVTYGLSEWGITSPEVYEHIHRFAVTQRELFRNLKPITGAPAALRRLFFRQRKNSHHHAQTLHKILSPICHSANDSG